MSSGTPLPADFGLTLFMRSPAPAEVSVTTRRLPSTNVRTGPVDNLSIVTRNRKLVSHRKATAATAAPAANSSVLRIPRVFSGMLRSFDRDSSIATH